MAYIHAFGADYYLDEEDWVRRITGAANDHPWGMDDIVAIQRRMETLNDLLFEYMRRTAAPDPLGTLRKHLDEMIAEGEN